MSTDKETHAIYVIASEWEFDLIRTSSADRYLSDGG
jgi:hypothetical protein